MLNAVNIFQIADITPSQEIKLSPDLLNKIMDENKVKVSYIATIRLVCFSVDCSVMNR